MGLCVRPTVIQRQIPKQEEFVKVHRHLFFIERMLRLKAFPWQSATTTQLLAGQMAHGMNGTLTDGGTLHREELHPQIDCKEEGGLA